MKDLMNELQISAENILDCLSEGVYVCDLDRRIVFWSKSAERITGWRSEDVLGRACHEGILCHEDKDGHRLCGKEHCPLHRSMITGVTSTKSLILFARGKNGRRIPMQVNTAPLHDSAGEVIGGVETFRMDGKVTVKGLEADVDLSFSDIWDELNFALMLAYEARKGNWGLWGNTIYANLGDDNISGPLGLTDIDPTFIPYIFWNSDFGFRI